MDSKQLQPYEREFLKLLAKGLELRIQNEKEKGAKDLETKKTP